MIEKFDFTIKRDTWDTRPPRVLSSRLSRMATRAATETSCKARCSFKSLLTVKIKCNNNLGKDYNNFLWMLDLKSGYGGPDSVDKWSGLPSLCHNYETDDSWIESCWLCHVSPCILARVLSQPPRSTADTCLGLARTLHILNLLLGCVWNNPHWNCVSSPGCSQLLNFRYLDIFNEVRLKCG